MHVYIYTRIYIYVDSRERVYACTCIRSIDIVFNWSVSFIYNINYNTFIYLKITYLIEIKDKNNPYN